MLFTDGKRNIHWRTAGGGPLRYPGRLRCVDSGLPMTPSSLMHRIRKGQFTLSKLRTTGKTAPEIWNAVLAA